MSSRGVIMVRRPRVSPNGSAPSATSSIARKSTPPRTTGRWRATAARGGGPGRVCAGPGAWARQGRFSSLNVCREGFTGGLADPNLWTNNLYTVDLGLSWYLNEYAKIYMNWEHAVFGEPVVYRPGGLQKTSDLFWLRFQLFF